MLSFTDENFISLCDHLALKDPDLGSVIQQYGYPPLWTRPASFETLIHIILEQQVSLASALAALNKLKEKISEITPESLLALTDKELKACYFSRQKIVYAKHLACEIISGELRLDALYVPNNEAVKINLTKKIGRAHV